jgi:hypothetical protein
MDERRSRSFDHQDEIENNSGRKKEFATELLLISRLGCHCDSAAGSTSGRMQP